MPYLKAQVKASNTVLFEVNFLNSWTDFLYKASTTREQATIVPLNVGDSVSVFIPASPSVCIFSSIQRHIGFFGFLLALQ